MTGKFIVSLDCEGKWGMADNLQPYHHKLLTNEALARVYSDIVQLFSEYSVPATFAYVMAFTLNEAERHRFSYLFDDNGTKDSWLSQVRDAQRRGSMEGWFQPEALDIVRKHPQHEIACHSFCHRPLAEAATSTEEARVELDAAEEIGRAKGIEFATFIYPRNQVGHVEVLAQKGYLGYRELRRRREGRVGRLQALAEEFDIWPRAETPAPLHARNIIAIPAGYFFNWRFGMRRRVPPSITVQRWKTLLNRAADTGGVAHLWFHPHNLISGPETREPLERVLAHAADLVKKGRLKIVTQEAYCREMLSAS